MAKGLVKPPPESHSESGAERRIFVWHSADDSTILHPAYQNVHRPYIFLRQRGETSLWAAGCARELALGGGVSRLLQPRVVVRMPRLVNGFPLVSESVI